MLKLKGLSQARASALPPGALPERTGSCTCCLAALQADRRKVLCWVVDTAEALAAAGAPGFDSLYDMLLPGWTHSWIE